ncbi:MAG: alpha/beta fold hydrolase [Bacteroidota bacterium]
MKLFSRKFGDHSQSLVILHGVFGSSDNWQTIAKRLSDNYSVYTLDARNHGQSPHDNALNFDGMAEDLIEFIDDNALLNPILIGHSMGGKTVMAFADKYPDEAKNMVVIDIGPKNYPIHHRQIIDALLSINFTILKTRKDVEMELGKTIPDFGTRQFLMKSLYWKNDTELDWRFNVQAIKDNINEIGIGQLHNHPYLKPTLFIKGDKSNYILEEDWDDILKLFPHAKLCTVKNAGHWVHADNPEGFMECLNDFLSKQ